MNYYETVAAEAAREAAAEAAREVRYCQTLEKLQHIFSANYQNMEELDDAVEKILTTDWWGDCKFEYDNFIQKHNHIRKARATYVKKIQSLIDADLDRLEADHKKLHSRTWTVKENDQLYADFFKLQEEHGYTSGEFACRYQYRISSLQAADAAAIERSKHRKETKLREQQKAVEIKRQRDEVSATKQRALEAGYRIRAEIFGDQIRDIVREVMLARCLL